VNAVSCMLHKRTLGILETFISKEVS